jgi:glutathionyl-hydroquinone reductase
MTTLTGSEKQISWAETIITEWNESFGRILQYAKDRVGRQTMPAAWSAHTETVVNQAKSKIATLTKASDIINLKKRSNVPAIVEQQIAATWKA